LELADRALREERYYDAHWLATLAGRLGSSGSIETVNAARLASRAWNGIASLEPNRREEQTYRLYHLKQTGYGAMIADDWISAYYIFKELAGLTPQDPDVTNFLALCEQKAGELAFFIDEMDMVFGEVLTGVVFSIPQKTASGIPDGRIVIRIQSLTVFADTSYGLELEGVAFDGQGRLIWRVEAPYVKIIPKTLGSEARLVVMMRALNREDKELYREPQWSGSERSGIGNAQIMLDLSYEEFLLLVRVRRGIDNFYIRDFFSAAENLGAFGYVPQVFQAEILRRIAEPFLFLSMTILVIVIGWRFRAKKRSRYMRIPMLGLLPLVFNGVTLIFRSAVSSLSIWLLLSLSFNSAMIVVLAGGAVFFFLSLIFLAAQHG
jgi:hypothetical protein